MVDVRVGAIVLQLYGMGCLKATLDYSDGKVMRVKVGGQCVNVMFVRVGG